MSEQIFLDTAIKIGDRLVKTALWDGNKCTWYVMSPDRENRSSKQAKKELAEGAVYQGASGIALFLIELFKFTNDEKVKDCIKGALTYAFDKGKELNKNSFGFHSGRIGIAYALFNAGKAFNNEELLKEAIELIEPMSDYTEKDYGIDVIGGAGGAIQPLLRMYEHLNDDAFLNLAVKLGDNLINIANMEPGGFSWGGSNSNYRSLCGYAHGAAGIGHALLELYNFTLDGKYLFAFERSVDYENQFYSDENLNWPDFRYSELSEYIYEERVEELKEVLRQNSLPPYEIKYMNAWCHGSPGIALNRLRAFELLGDDKYKSDAINAIKGTVKSFTSSNRHNYSLCHGIGGNSDALIYGGRLLGSLEYIEKAKGLALKGIESYEEKNIPWPCGTMGSVSDPSLMLGEAGIGYYLLRLYSQDVPLVLAVTTQKELQKELEPDNSYQEIKNDYADRYFGRTIAGVNKLFDYRIPVKNSIAEIHESIKDFIDTLKEDDKKLATDLFISEEKIYLKILNLADFSSEYRVNLIKKDVSEINWDNAKLFLSENVELIENEFAWEEWFNKNNKTKPSQEENYKVIYKLQNRFYVKPINTFPAIILHNFSTDNSVAQINERVSVFFDENTINANELKEKIILQLKEFYKVGYIKIMV
ncbi:MAG: lanthionine synthetase LanC family protein [Ignavibacteria bacterium]|jgi:lantibiotic modifying enzyme